MEIREYLGVDGVSPFAQWFNRLDASAAVKVTVALKRMEQGNHSKVKGVGGIFEFKINYGPGYRIYFGRDGDVLILLLGGGIKKTQNKDIIRAKNCWIEYKQRKAAGEVL